MKPRLLDIFCGAGGCTKGYQDAGFYVAGADINPQPNYCGDEFVKVDALEYLAAAIEGFDPFTDFYDAIHASPPCQLYSSLNALHPDAERVDLVAPTRALLQATGLPYVIENVVGAPLENPFMLCGSSFGLGVWRHRIFETSFDVGMLPPCSHREHPEPLDVTGTGGPSGQPRKAGGGKSRKPRSLEQAGAAMGIDWMTRRELSQAVPPAYTKWIGEALLGTLEEREAA